MNSNYLISIIVPIFNSEKYLERCINSICNQSYSNLEIILINDGSTDLSGEICDNYSKIDKRIHVIHTSNFGQASARNIGIDISNGDYIGFVDSDDFIDKEMYQLMLNNAINEGADLVQIGHYVVNENEDILNVEKRSRAFFYNLIEKINAVTIEKVIVSSICDKLFHKSLWNGTKMQEGYYYEDGMVLLNLLKSSKKTMIIDKVGYYYVLSKYSTQRGPYNIRHLESCLYEPDFYYNFFTIHAKEFKEYGVALKCYRSMRGYRFLKHVKNIDYVTKNEYKLKFFNKFSDNYLYLKRTNYYKKISFYEKTAMLIFSINPNIYVLFFYFSKKIANSIKRRFLAKKN